MDTLVIKRYSNRKLYNTETSSYLTLKDIVVQVAGGRNVQVIDNRTKDEITGSILLKAFVEYEADELNSQVPMFVDIIKAGGLAKYVNGLTQPTKEIV